MKAVAATLFATIASCAFAFGIRGAAGATYQEKIVWSFGGGTDGAAPVAGLTDVNGVLYGTTGQGGGTPNSGTVFSLDPKTKVEKVLYSFCSQQNCADGGGADGGLIAVKGLLYGTTYGGGSIDTGNCGGGCGTVFSLDPNTGAEAVVHSFGATQDGAVPFAGLTAVKSTLYGTTLSGGAYGYGTVFSIDPGTGAEKVLHSFGSGEDGSAPYSTLIVVKGKLYGTTFDGGTDGQGTVFSVDPNSGAETVIYSFAGGKDGANPYAGVTALAGMLYGTTTDGGSGTGCGFGCGTVFALDPNTGAESVLHAFSIGADGVVPFAAMIAVNGVLYGTTTEGGGGNCDEGCGSVFSVDSDTGAETVLHSFCVGTNCTDGKSPYGSLVYLNKELYGTTEFGGADDNGIVFALSRKH